MTTTTTSTCRLRSMTGYGRGQFHLGHRSFCVELRSYNNRFLDVKIRVPWSTRELDGRVEARVRGRVCRGRVDVAVREEAGAGATGRLRLDRGLAVDLSTALGDLADTLGCDLATAARLVPPMRELLESEPDSGLSADAVWSALDSGLSGALDQLLEMRQREGEATLSDLVDNLAQLEDFAGKIRDATADEPRLHRDRLMGRLQKWRDEGVSFEEDRVVQEVALMADRSDVGEELARLSSHVAQMREIFAQEEPAGRKMEFLIQELNRELNTIGSKSLGAGVAHLVVEAKACVERMREQAQNVE